MKLNGKGSEGRQRLTPEQRAQLVEQFETRRVSTETFAAQHGVGVSTLYYWQRRSRKGKVPAPRVPLREVSLSEVMRSGSNWIGEVQLPEGTCVRWNNSLSASALGEVLRQLRRPC